MNSVLLDTQVFLFALQDSPRLSKLAKQTYEDPSVEKLLSHASVWEMSIKIAIGKLHLDEDLREVLRRYEDEGRLTLAPIELDQVLAVRDLPHHHRDPFDRLLAVVSLEAGLPMLSSDPAMDAYGVNRVW